MNTVFALIRSKSFLLNLSKSPKCQTISLGEIILAFSNLFFKSSVPANCFGGTHFLIIILEIRLFHILHLKHLNMKDFS